jgi:hypothetical protein
VHTLPRGHGLAGARVLALADGEGRPGDVDLLANIASGIAGNTICPLGEAAAWPMLGFLTKFRADFEAKAKGREIRIVNVILAGPSFLEKIAFVVFAVGLLGGALVTITRKSAVAASLRWSGLLCAMAGLYATLSAHFLAVLQILVYAGAIMVLFIFAVMIVNRDDAHPIALRGLFVRAAGCARHRVPVLPRGVDRGARTADRRAGHRDHAAHSQTTETSLPSGGCSFRTFSFPSRPSRCCFWRRWWRRADCSTNSPDN